jgi:2-deoxy-D-gluconate 3-dehydrogenase
MSLEAFQLNGKNALVTGSHRGLGAAIALALAKTGANVGCHGRDPKPSPSCAEILAAGRKAFYFSGDLADSKGYLGPIEKTVAKFGSIDILVNNAGVIRRAPASEYPTEFWDELIAVNLTAVFRG